MATGSDRPGTTGWAAIRPVLVGLMLVVDAFVVLVLVIGRHKGLVPAVHRLRDGAARADLVHGWADPPSSRRRPTELVWADARGNLDSAVRTVVRQCMGVSAGEEVLVRPQPVTEEIGALMRIEGEGDGAEATLAVISERETHAAEPPRPVAAAMAAADVVLAPTIQSLSHTAARKAASDAGVRIATLPGVTEEMLARLMNGDLEEIRRRGWGEPERAERRLRGADHLRPRQRPAVLEVEGRDGDRRRGRTLRPRAPSATCPAARASSPRSKGPPRGRWWSTGRSPAIGAGRVAGPCSPSEGGHLTGATGATRAPG